MQDANRLKIISEALDWANEMNPQDTDGAWLEDLTVQVGPYIKEWDVDQCYPGRNGRSEKTTTQIAQSRMWELTLSRPAAEMASTSPSNASPDS